MQRRACLEVFDKLYGHVEGDGYDRAVEGDSSEERKKPDNCSMGRIEEQTRGGMFGWVAKVQVPVLLQSKSPSVGLVPAWHICFRELKASC